MGKFISRLIKWIWIIEINLSKITQSLKFASFNSSSVSHVIINIDKLNCASFVRLIHNLIKVIKSFNLKWKKFKWIWQLSAWKFEKALKDFLINSVFGLFITRPHQNFLSDRARKFYFPRLLSWRRFSLFPLDWVCNNKWIIKICRLVWHSKFVGKVILENPPEVVWFP